MPRKPSKHGDKAGVFPEFTLTEAECYPARRPRHAEQREIQLSASVEKRYRSFGAQDSKPVYGPTQNLVKRLNSTSFRKTFAVDKKYLRK